MSEDKRLGAEVERNGRRFVRSDYWHSTIAGKVVRLDLLTPIPDGMTAQDLGLRFPGAILEGADLVLILEHLRQLVAKERSA